MPDFKTHLNALLESLDLKYGHAQAIPLNYQANSRVETRFTAPCAGFLFVFMGSQVTGCFISSSTLGNNIVNYQYATNNHNWLSVNLMVSKGETYSINIDWLDEGLGNSRAVFVPFTYSRQKS